MKTLKIKTTLKKEDDITQKGPLNLCLWLLTPTVTCSICRLTVIRKYVKHVKPEMELCTKCAALAASKGDINISEACQTGNRIIHLECFLRHCAPIKDANIFLPKRKWNSYVWPFRTLSKFCNILSSFIQTNGGKLRHIQCAAYSALR